MYSLDVRQRSRDLFVENSLSYTEVAKETGVSSNNLKKWGVDEKWIKQREEYQRDYSAFHAKLRKLQLELVNSALDKGEDGKKKIDAQAVYALAAVMRAKQVNTAGAGAQDKPQWFIECIGKFLEFVKGRDPDALRYLEPHIGPFAEAVKTQ